MRPGRWVSWAGAAVVAAAGVTIGVTLGVTIGATSAQAAVPDRAGFVLFSSGAVTHALPPTTTVTPGVPGRWQVRFPGLGIASGVVHVTAVHNAAADPPARWCQADSWSVAGVDELVNVSCYRIGGILDDRPGFSVQFSRSSGPVAGGFYSYVDSSAAGV